MASRGRARIDPLHPINEPDRSETVPPVATLASAEGVDDREPSGTFPGTGGLTDSELLSPAAPPRRFVLHPAWIVSRTGQRHFVDAGPLAELYGLRLDDPDVVVGAFAARRTDVSRRPGDVDLWPRFDGDYRHVR